MSKKYTKQELDARLTPAKVNQLEVILGSKEAAAELIEQLYAELGSQSKEQTIGVGYKATTADAPNIDAALALLEEAKPLFYSGETVQALVQLLGAETALATLKILNGKKPPSKVGGNVAPVDEGTSATKGLGDSVVAQMLGAVTVARGKSMIGDMAAIQPSTTANQDTLGKSMVERMAAGENL